MPSGPIIAALVAGVVAEVVAVGAARLRWWWLLLALPVPFVLVAGCLELIEVWEVVPPCGRAATASGEALVVIAPLVVFCGGALVAGALGSRRVLMVLVVAGFVAGAVAFAAAGLWEGSLDPGRAAAVSCPSQLADP